MSKKSGDTWIAETSMGTIEIELTPYNDLGIIDHVVTLSEGTKVDNPLRVIKNEEGSEVIFTLFHMPGKTEKDLEEDAQLVIADLAKLKEILENR